MGKLAPQEFINKYKSIAINDALFSGIPPSIKLAQAALESGWDDSLLAREANNKFGIKSHNWGGATYNAATHEFYGSERTDIKADFRAYGSPQESFIDHSNFLIQNPTYAPLFELDFLDYKGWARQLKASGYATSPTYSDKLIALVEKYNLQELDLDASRNKLIYKISVWSFFLALLIIALILLKVIK